MIKIDGVVLPTPSDYLPGIMDISKAERNANGTMIIERIATKRKIEVSWEYLSQENLTKILSLVSPVFFTVEYIDPLTGLMKIGTFYAGDRVPKAMDYKNGKMRWKDFKFSLIER